MDVDFWAARIHSAKHFSAVQAARLNNSDSHLATGDEGEDEVCPICAATLGKDAIGHFTMQHSQSVKRRRKSQKSGMWSNTSATGGKDLRELTSFLGSNSLSSQSDGHEPAPDPLLSPFLCSRPFSDPKDSKKDVSSSYAGSTANADGNRPSFADAVQEQNYEERTQRAAFFQEVIISTIF